MFHRGIDQQRRIRIGLASAARPEVPWFGYSLGDWEEEWDKNALQATRGEWMERSESYRQRRRRGVAPNTSSRGKLKD